MDEIIDGRALWDSLHDAVFWLDRTGRIQKENAAARRQTGFGPGRFLQDALPDTFAHQFRQACETGAISVAELFWPAQESWVEVQIVPERTGVSVTVRDITHRHQIEAASRDNMARLDALYEHSFDAIGVAARGVHVFVNRSYLALFGYAEPEDLLNRPVLELIAPSEHTVIQHRMDRRRDGLEETFQYETRGRRQDGTEFDIEFRVSPYRLAGEMHTLVILRDLTAQKAAEKELRDSEARFRAITEHSGVGLWHISLARETLYCNPAMCVLLEVETPQEVMQRDYHDFFPEESRRIMEHEHQKRHRGQASSYEVSLVGLHGGQRRVMVSGAPIFGLDGQLESILGTFTDLTVRHQAEAARRQAEEKYRSIFKNAREGLFRTSPEGRILSANPALAQMQGYASPEEMIADINNVGRQIYVDPNRRTDFLERLRVQRQVTEFESQIYRRDGSIIWISESIRAICDRDNTVLCYEGSSIDITTRKTLEMEREHLLREAVQRAEQCAVTGLLNHRAFHRRLREETEIATESGGRLAVVALDMDNFKFFNDTYGHLAGDDVLRRVADTLRAHCRTSDALARIGGDEFALLMPGLSQEDAEAVAGRLTKSLMRDGFCPPGVDRPVPLSLSAGVAVFPQSGTDAIGTLHQADIRLLAAKRERASAGKTAQEKTIYQEPMLEELIEALEAKDRQTRRHSAEVQKQSLIVGRRLCLDDADLETLSVAALLHDIGKVSVPNRILCKPGPLSGDEWERVLRHPAVGAALIGAALEFAGIDDVAAAVRHHHERWDGLGYPEGLQGESIPLLARILAVAEAFAAMTADCPYAAAMSEAEAYQTLRTGAGSHWDPACIDAFLAGTLTAQRPAA